MYYYKLVVGYTKIVSFQSAIKNANITAAAIVFSVFK